MQVTKGKNLKAILKRVVFLHPLNISLYRILNFFNIINIPVHLDCEAQNFQTRILNNSERPTKEKICKMHDIFLKDNLVYSNSYL